jgi:ATP-dependent Clp protease protease subunit
MNKIIFILFFLVFNLSKIQASEETSETESLSNVTTAEVAEIMALNKQLKLLKLQNEVLSTQGKIQTERYQNQLLQLKQEKELLKLTLEVQQAKSQQKVAKLQAEKEKQVLENELQEAKKKQYLANLDTLTNRLQLENERSEQEQKKLLAELETKKAKLVLQNAIFEEKNKEEQLKMESKMVNLVFEKTKLEFEKTRLKLEQEKLTIKISERTQLEKWDSQVNKAKKYLINPIVNGVLVISDRKITLEQVIIPGTALSINERIYYFNNKSTEYPIFLVIDTCYGGSVMEGVKILEAIQASKAPVYVVVKTLAASMAAVITTLAEHSYAYPNAIIIHHQLSSSITGNQRQIKEQLEIVKTWAKRILKPVTKKMGISLEEFVKKMYENSSTGDWHEFADVAVKLKWVNTIVKNILDSSIIKQPEEKTKNSEGKEKIDSQGLRYIKLPSINPLDAYYLYNPLSYYR